MGFRVKRNDNVWVCYDGKWGRRQPGTVVKAGRYKVWVSFTPWASDDAAPVTACFSVRRLGGTRRWSGANKGIQGWVNMGSAAPGPNTMPLPGGCEWYRVYKRKCGQEDAK